MSLSCVACHELLSSSANTYAAKCGHVLHHPCWVKWLTRNNNCPQCRQTTYETDLIRLYLNSENGKVQNVEYPPESIILDKIFDNLSSEVQSLKVTVSKSKRTDASEDSSTESDLNSCSSSYSDISSEIGSDSDTSGTGDTAGTDESHSEDTAGTDGSHSEDTAGTDGSHSEDTAGTDGSHSEDTADTDVSCYEDTDDTDVTRSKDISDADVSGTEDSSDISGDKSYTEESDSVPDTSLSWDGSDELESSEESSLRCESKDSDSED